MKKEKIARIALIISMYLPQVFIVLDAILIRFIVNDTLLLSFLIVAFVLMGISFIVGLINVGIAFQNIFRDTPSPARFTIIMKLVLIPWYFLNFLVWLLLVGICANPWLMLAVPLVIGMGIAYTFAFLFFTNVYNFSYVIKLVKEKKIQLTKSIILPVVLHFIFVLDILGSMLLHKKIQEIEIDNRKVDMLEDNPFK
ncbi:MAG: hypothetical protein K2O22_05055 [Anaeroplasmataceae bacterium]|nr:hypothetical protein [Anaeroplasmataceae bacterium]